MDDFLALLGLFFYYVIWIPIKYAGIGSWWLITYPSRKHKKDQDIAAREVERRARVAQQEAAKLARLQKEKEMAEQKALAAKIRERQAKEAEAERLMKEAEKKATQEARLNIFLDNLKSFDTLMPKLQTELAQRETMYGFRDAENVENRVFEIICNWIRLDPENNLKLEVISSLCSYFRGIQNKFTRHCTNLISELQKAPNVTKTDIVYCRAVLNLKLFKQTSLPAFVQIESNYYIGVDLTPIVCNDWIVNRPCYMKTEVKVVTQRQSQGEKYYDMDNARQEVAYLFDDALEFVGDGNWNIDINSIIDIRLDEKSYDKDSVMLVITCRNSPNIYLWCTLSVVAQLKASLIILKQRLIEMEKIQ